MDDNPILGEVAALRSLVDVLAWAHAREPRAEFVEVVGMDEFTNDVVVRVAPALYLVFDST